jgi:hypothetical protein
MKNLPHYNGFIALSVLGHVIALYPAITPGVIEFQRPVSPSPIIMVNLAAPVGSVPPLTPPLRQAVVQTRAETPAQLPVAPQREAVGERLEEYIESESAVEDEMPLVAPAGSPVASPVVEDTPPKAVATTPSRIAPFVQPPLRLTEEFISLERETLIYQVRLRGAPVGTAQMEASSSGGEFRISLKMNSAPALSAIYPVQSQIETRHIGGNFIITKIRRQEGSLRSDRGFTISLRDKSVFWADLLKRRSTTETIPTSEVLDPFSALYLLRNRPLQVGKTELLHVYDGDAYSELPVEIVRAEQMHLPGKGDVQTLVLKPQLRHDAVFSRTGEMLIWVTNDEFKVPVKVETSILLGKVTAELVSAESVPSSDSPPKSPSSTPQF